MYLYGQKNVHTKFKLIPYALVFRLHHSNKLIYIGKRRVGIFTVLFFHSPVKVNTTVKIHD